MSSRPRLLRAAIAATVLLGASYTIAVILPLYYRGPVEISAGRFDPVHKCGWAQWASLFETWVFANRNAVQFDATGKRLTASELIDSAPAISLTGWDVPTHPIAWKYGDQVGFFPAEFVEGTAPLPGWTVPCVTHVLALQRSPYDTGAVISVGWPVRWLWYSASTASDTLVVRNAVRPWASNDRRFPGQPAELILPTGLIWPGFGVIVALCMGTSVAGVYLLPALRAYRRRRLCLCVTCCYPKIPGRSGLCTECGEP